MNKPKVFIFAPADSQGGTHQTLEMEGCEVIIGKASWHTPDSGDNEPEVAGIVSDCDALAGTSIRNPRITGRIMQNADKLRIVAKYTIGVDDVDVDAATDLGILVTHSPTESNWGGVAEGAIAMMLTLLKKTRERDRYLKESGPWRNLSFQGTYVGARADGYEGITIGLVGLGRIGSRVATLMRPWNARIIACDPYVPESKFTEHGVLRTDLSTLIRKSDVVSLHVVLNRETRHMIGAAELALMKPTAILINTSRGFCVDEAALVEALKAGKIAGAALDVFENEPLPIGSPLRTLGDKVLLSPHMVSANLGCGLGPGVIWATEGVRKALRGEVPEHVFNREAIPAWEKRFGGRPLL